MAKKAKYVRSKIYYFPEHDIYFDADWYAKQWCEKNGVDPSTVVKFASVAEYIRYMRLRHWENEGRISNLKRHEKFVIVPAEYETYLAEYRPKTYYYVDYTKFDTMRMAVRYCQVFNVPEDQIVSWDEDKPVYKKRRTLPPEKFVADFSYDTPDKVHVVETVRASHLKDGNDFKLRKRLMRHVLGIDVKEI